MRIIFVDLNNNLVTKVKALGIESCCDDYFRKLLEIPQAVLMTASNPHFSFGGGIDAKFAEYFPYYCKVKQTIGGKMERIGNIVFAITVDSNFKADKETVRKAINFALSKTYRDETLVLSGVGTGIGGMSDDDFVEILKELLTNESTPQ